MKDYLKIADVSEEITSENVNPITNDHDISVNTRWSPLCERAHEINGSGRNSFAKLWKRDYSTEEWANIMSKKAIAQGVIKPRDIVPQPFEGADGVTRTRKNISLVKFNGDTDEQALARSSWGEDKVVFLTDAEAEKVLADVVLVEEAPADVVAETVPVVDEEPTAEEVAEALALVAKTKKTAKATAKAKGK